MEEEMSLVQSIVKAIRSIRQEYNLTKAKPEGMIPLTCHTPNEHRASLIKCRINFIGIETSARETTS